jgi:hypothetical protein
MACTFEDLPRIAERLIAVRDAHPPGVYDEAFDEIAERFAKVGSVGKADIGGLLFWKRLRADTPWARALHSVPDHVVRTATAAARTAAHDGARTTVEAAGAARRALSPLPGFVSGDALASAVIAAANPARMAVYDQRADAALRDLGCEVDDRPGRYGRYMAAIGELLGTVKLQRPDWTARDVDLALYWLGGD